MPAGLLKSLGNGFVLTAKNMHETMRRIAFVTGHYYRSSRRGGIHWLARAFHRAGWDVLFFTCGLSYISKFNKDHRFQYPVLAEANEIRKLEERFSSFVWFTPWHPVKLRPRPANCLFAPLFRQYGNLPLYDAEDAIRKLNVIVIESGPGLALVDRLKRINPSARFVYRVSDDLQVLQASSLLVEAERKWAPQFDLITAPSFHILKKFDRLTDTAVHPQGLAKELFDCDHDDPYRDHATPNLISVGNMIYDLDFLDRASRMFPDWRFHVIGWLSKVPQKSNILFYGEKPFEEAIPFLKYADIGLSPYRDRPGNTYLADSSHKIIQYTYCRLPIVAPHSVADQSLPHVIGYRPGDDDSIRTALEKALTVDRNAIDRSGIPTWDEIARDLTGYLM